MTMISRRSFLTALPAASSLTTASSILNGTQAYSKESKPKLKDRLFIMSPWFYQYKVTAIQMAELLHYAGCPRISYSLGNANDERWKSFDQTLEGFDKGKCQLAAVYAGINIDSGECPPHIIKLIEKLKGRKTIIWLYLQSKKFGLSDPAGDDLAVKILRQASESAKQANLTLSIYPHFNNWAEQTSDAFRIAEKADRDNMGCTFNLYHWLKVEGPDNLKEKAKSVLPKLNTLTINGTMNNAKELTVDEGILPLGKGNYDVAEFIRIFNDIGYKGPVGLQGYSIKGDIPALLKQSVETWNSYCQSISS